MDPRDTPAYRLHRALSSLHDIETDNLDATDRARIEAATTLLQQTDLLTMAPDATRD